MISLYFHIPFCSKKCPYCHFYVIANRPLFHSLLMEGLCLEWEAKAAAWKDREICSIYFGGGTPSLFAQGIGALLQTIRSQALLTADCEITVEANPEESHLSLFETLRAFGVNRISLGVQSLDDRSLATLERMHTAKQAIDALLAAEKAGFRNVSIDLMYDLPDQTESSWLYTLGQLSTLPIQHLSLYNLTIEPHTAFDRRRASLSLPGSAMSLRLLEQGVRAIEAAGLMRYEISAFCRPFFTSRHNLGYWTARPFLGFGPSAFSYWEGERFQNISHLQQYVQRLKEGKSPVALREKLPYPQNVKELFAVQLRVLEGVRVPQELTLAVDLCVQQQLLRYLPGGKVQLTDRGMLLYDTVAAELM